MNLTQRSPETIERVLLRRHQPNKASVAGLSSWKEIQMRKAYWFVVAAVVVTMLAGVGGWMILTSPADATKAVDAGVQIDPMQMMKNAKSLPAEHYDDYSLVFN